MSIYLKSPQGEPHRNSPAAVCAPEPDRASSATVQLRSPSQGPPEEAWLGRPAAQTGAGRHQIRPDLVFGLGIPRGDRRRSCPAVHEDLAVAVPATAPHCALKGGGLGRLQSTPVLCPPQLVVAPVACHHPVHITEEALPSLGVVNTVDNTTRQRVAYHVGEGSDGPAAPLRQRAGRKSSHSPHLPQR
jgi:hypothetical protein